MDVRSELVARIMVLANGRACTSSAVEVMLQDYAITKAQSEPTVDLQQQISHFLGAKKIEGLSVKTLKNYSLYLRHFSLKVCKTVKDITTDDVRTFIGGLQMKDSSIRTVVNILCSFFGWLTIEEVINKNPMLRIKVAKRSNKSTRNALSREALEKLRNACQDARERALVEFMYSTGCRVSEVVGISLDCVDFEQRSVVVQGKGNKDRTVYFSIKAKLLLDQYLAERQGGISLFSNVCKPYAPMQSRMMQKVVKIIGERAAIHTKVHPHLLRHTFATLALNNGMEITAIQKVLGHASVSTTELYACMRQDNVRQQHDRAVA